ncbi:protein kinase domain-containing protein [Metarhizium rileyi]|uniref:non-specific serine/threonine protein kinase n=1 Tax=Metarhizium rileyi (strain RCEF 4871) TaxID=1649241 RepID=A0A166ZGT2_METRR|nr:protein kinase domain-containing protein [Metarhizium rileyi RCEF 4871]
MASLLKWSRGLLSRSPLPPLRFPATGFETISKTELLEEENYQESKTGSYCAVEIGDVYASNKYQILGKLGFGSTSTVWLARNLHDRGYAALKIFKRDYDDTCKNELRIHDSIEKANPSHPGHGHIRTAAAGKIFCIAIQAAVSL